MFVLKSSGYKTHFLSSTSNSLVSDWVEAIWGYATQVQVSTWIDDHLVDCSSYMTPEFSARNSIRININQKPNAGVYSKAIMLALV